MRDERENAKAKIGLGVIDSRGLQSALILALRCPLSPSQEVITGPAPPASPVFPCHGCMLRTLF